jgi:hypothetical protein
MLAGIIGRPKIAPLPMHRNPAGTRPSDTRSVDPSEHQQNQAERRTVGRRTAGRRCGDALEPVADNGEFRRKRFPVSSLAAAFCWIGSQTWPTLAIGESIGCAAAVSTASARRPALVMLQSAADCRKEPIIPPGLAFDRR